MKTPRKTGSKPAKATAEASAPGITHGPRPTGEVPSEQVTIIYRHKTVSVPPGADSRLDALQKLFLRMGSDRVRSMLINGNVIDTDLQRVLDSSGEKPTKGMVFWIAVEALIQRLGGE